MRVEEYYTSYLIFYICILIFCLLKLILILILFSIKWNVEIIALKKPCRVFVINCELVKKSICNEGLHIFSRKKFPLFKASRKICQLPNNVIALGKTFSSMESLFTNFNL